MTTASLGAAASVLAVVAAAAAQPATEIRFPNGKNSYTAHPGESVRVSVYARGLPAVGTMIPWTTPPGTGGLYANAGFQAARMNVLGASSSPVAWSQLTIPGGMGFYGPPFGSAGGQSGAGVTGIIITTWVHPPVTSQSFLLWQGTVTMGTSDLTLRMETLAPIPELSTYRGFEIGLSNTGLNYQHVLSVADGTGAITVCYPDCNSDGALTLADFGCFMTKFALGC